MANYTPKRLHSQRKLTEQIIKDEQIGKYKHEDTNRYDQRWYICISYVWDSIKCPVLINGCKECKENPRHYLKKQIKNKNTDETNGRQYL